MAQTYEKRQVVIIGAGPSGAVAAALLVKQGIDVLVLEKAQFPRFSIGESLLPHCLDILNDVGMLSAVEAQGFQIKNGAAFALGDNYSVFDFAKQFTQPSYSYAYEVKRGEFDKVLADCAQAQGAEIRYGEQIESVEFFKDEAILTVRKSNHTKYKVRSSFVLDGSGYGRVLVRLLNLEKPSNLAPRQAIFTHVEDNISSPYFERDKILISVHPLFQDVWFWLIPFSDGRSSIGVVGEIAHFKKYDDNLELILHDFINTTPQLAAILSDAKWDTPYQKLVGYSTNVSQLYGKRYALLGNSAEFLDPVFSSGVTIALYGAKLATDVLVKQFKGSAVDWECEFAQPLQRGVDTFRTYVIGWYEQTFQRIIFQKSKNETVTKMICSVLAGYAWDEKNPFVKEHEQRFKLLEELCRDHI